MKSIQARIMRNKQGDSHRVDILYYSESEPLKQYYFKTEEEASEFLGLIMQKINLSN